MARKLKLPSLAGRAAAKATPTQTGYTATGTAQIPRPQLDNEMGSSQPVRIQEIVPELASAYSRLVTYTRMMNDAGVDVSMRAAKTPILGADFYMEPYSDSQEDIDIADFCWNNLAGGMADPFVSSLEDILHMYEDGYAVLEKVYENRQWTPSRAGANAKNYTMLKRLCVRPASTISTIEYDDNGIPKTITQNAVQGDKSTKEIQFDPEKLLIFTFGKVGGDLTGRSLLRTAYPHWYYKTHFYKIDAIQKERHSLGVPIGKLQAGYKPSDKSILRTMLRNLRTNEEAFLILPPSIDVEFAQIHGNLVDVLASATHHNVMILMNVMAQFLAMGVESSGSRAAGANQTDVFMKALKYVANYIADIINMYLIPELVVWNFPTNSYPKLRVRNIGETRDLQMLGAALGNLYAQGAITTDDPTEDYIRKIFDMPQKVAGATSPTTGSSPTTDTPVAPATNGNGNSQHGAQKPGAIKPGTSSAPPSSSS